MGQRGMSKWNGPKRNEQENWAKEKWAREMEWARELEWASEMGQREMSKRKGMSKWNGPKSSVINLEEIKFRAWKLCEPWVHNIVWLTKKC